MDTPRVPGAGFARGLGKSLGNDRSEFLATSAAVGKSHPVGFKLIEWSSLDRGTLKGYATVEMPSGMVMHDCPVFRSEDGQWSSIPASKPLVGAGGVSRDKTGKARFIPIITFTTKQHRDRWSGAVVAALRAARPEVFS